MKYKIVNIKKEFRTLIRDNPHIIQYLYSDFNDEYALKLNDNIFEKIDIDVICSFFENHIIYSEKEDCYLLINDVNQDKIKLYFYDYCILVYENGSDYKFYHNIVKKMGCFYIIE